MEYHGISWNTMEYHGISSIAINCLMLFASIKSSGAILQLLNHIIPPGKCNLTIKKNVSLHFLGPPRILLPGPHGANKM